MERKFEQRIPFPRKGKPKAINFLGKKVVIKELPFPRKGKPKSKNKNLRWELENLSRK